MSASSLLSLRVDKVNLADLPSVATVHCAAFPSSLLTALGHEAVRRYYAWQLTGPHQVVALAARAKGELVGFCFGGVFQGAMSGFLAKNRGYLAARVLMWPIVLLRPAFRQKIVKGLLILLRIRALKASRTEATPPLSRRAFGILSIAVSPASRGSEAAWELEKATAELAKQMGFREMELTVSPDNGRAVRFYERNGWMRIPSGPEWAGRMRKCLEGPDC